MFDNSVAVLPVKSGGTKFDNLPKDETIGDQIEGNGGLVLFAQESPEKGNKYRFKAVFSGAGAMSDEFKPGTYHLLRHDQTGASMGDWRVVANIQDTSKVFGNTKGKIAVKTSVEHYTNVNLDKERVGLAVFK